MYDKYTARPAVFLSCNFIERGPRGILCTRGAYGRLFTVRYT